MPDHWDTKPEHLFSVPDEQPDPASSSHHDPAHEIKLRDPSGRLRLPAYILIALVISAPAILLVTAGLLLAPS
jgi:hypothetical protein